MTLQLRSNFFVKLPIQTHNFHYFHKALCYFAVKTAWSSAVSSQYTRVTDIRQNGALQRLARNSEYLPAEWRCVECSRSTGAKQLVELCSCRSSSAYRSVEGSPWGAEEGENTCTAGLCADTCPIWTIRTTMRWKSMSKCSDNRQTL